jgi:GTP-binding protein EngB required for normal cell division
MNHIKCSGDSPSVILFTLESVFGSESSIRLDEEVMGVLPPTEIKFDILATKTDNISTKTRKNIAVFEIGILLQILLLV